MELQARLDALREASKARMPPEVRAVMLGHIEELRASGIVDRVVGVGQSAPDFTLPNAAGAPVSLADLRVHGPVVLSFYRGRWWPYCNAELEALQQALPEIIAAGATLAVISPQVARTPRETEEPKPLAFELLRDFGNRVAETYGLVFTLPEALRAIYLRLGIDLARGNGDGTWRLPIPARYVIDRQGVIRAVDADPDYTRRSEPARTVEVLRELPRPTDG
jgi:peroxiredoxin